MHHRLVHAVEHFCKNLLLQQHDAYRHVSAGKPLGEEQHVGLDAPVFYGEEAAGPPEPGLDFVGDEQRPIFPAKFVGGSEIIGRGHVDALALDRLDAERGDVALFQRALEREKIVEGDFDVAGDQRTEVLAVDIVAHRGKRSIGQSME